MNSITAGLSSSAARVLGRRATVLANTALSPRVRLLRFHLPSLHQVDLVPALRFKVEVAPGTLRSYTPSRWNQEERWVEMAFVIHGDTAGSRFARSAAPGDVVRFVGTKVSFQLDAAADWALCLGDETNLGLFQAVADHTPSDTHLLGAVELEAGDEPAVAALGLTLDPVPRSSQRGAMLERWLASWEIPPGRGVVYLSGHGGTARALWDSLQARGVPRAQIRVKPYWNKKEFMGR